MYIELHYEVSKVMIPFTFGLSHAFPSLLFGGWNFLVLAMFGKLCFLFLFLVCCVIFLQVDMPRIMAGIKNSLITEKKMILF